MSIFNKVTKTFTWGQHQVTMETGEIARQSSGAVVVDIEGTVVLATVVAKTEAKAGQDFFPLLVVVAATAPFDESVCFESFEQW